MRAWELFLTLQELEIGQETVHKWLRPLKILKFDACNLFLEAKDTFQALWFEEHIRSKVLTKLLNNNNKKIRVHLSVANTTPKTKPVKSKQETPAAMPPKFQMSFDEIDPHCTFENFVPSGHHQLVCKLLNGNELGTFNPIYIYGNSGSGKTHLLMAAVDAMRKKGMKVIYARTDTFTEHVVGAIRGGEMSAFRQAYRNVDALCLDDVQIFSRKGATQEELFHTFNTLHLAGKQIILSSNLAPADLQYIEPRLVSRFEWGIVIPLETLNSQETLTILYKKAAVLGFPLPPKIAEFLLQTFVSNLKSLSRALEALILRVHMHEKSGRTATSILTVPFVKTLLSDLIIEEQNAAITPLKVVQTVAEDAGIKADDLLGKAQSRDCVLPRQMAMYVCRTHLKMPFMRIADLFSKDHSTVMSSVKQVQKALELNEKEMVNSINSILKKLKT